MEVTWTGIPFNSFAGAPQGYKVVYYENTSAHALIYRHVFAPGLVHTTRIEGLRINTFYLMRVLAVNVFADGPLSDPISVKTTGKCKLRYSYMTELSK